MGDSSNRVSAEDGQARINMVQPIWAISLKCASAVEAEIANLLAAHPALGALAVPGTTAEAGPPPGRPAPGLEQPTGASSSGSTPQGPAQPAEDPAAVPTPEDVASG